MAVRGAEWPCAICHRNGLDLLVLLGQAKRTNEGLFTQDDPSKESAFV